MAKVDKKERVHAKASAAETASRSMSTLQILPVHLMCGLGIALALWVARNVYSINLVSDPSRTLRLLWVFEFPILILVYGRFRLNPDKCSYLRAAGRGALALPLGALLNVLGAIALGAPVGIQYIPKTIHWSLLMSSFTFVPAASVCGSSWTHWQRIIACTKTNVVLDYLICIPAHGAIIGAWFGAWPMPLDWERPWQEWPICVTYGAITGYLVAMLASFIIVVARGKHQHVKWD